MFNVTSEREESLGVIVANHKDNQSGYRIEDVLWMATLLQADGDDLHSDDPRYWSLMDSMLINMETGRWDMHPQSWRLYMRESSPTPLTEKEIERRLSHFLTMRNSMLRRLDLPSNQAGIRTAVIAWFQSMAGIDAALESIKLVFEMNFLSTKGK